MSYAHTARWKHRRQLRWSDRKALFVDQAGEWLVRKLNWSPHVDGVIVLTLVGVAVAAANVLALQI